MPIIVLSAVGDEEQKVARARGRRRRLRDQAVRARASWSPACRRRCAAPARRRTSRRSRSTASRSTSPRGRSRRDGEEVHLTPIEYDLLRTLARNRGRLLTHRALLTEVWGPAYADDTAGAAHPHRQPAAQDRAARAPPRYIRTDPGVGYRFAG